MSVLKADGQAGQYQGKVCHTSSYFLLCWSAGDTTCKVTLSCSSTALEQIAGSFLLSGWPVLNIELVVFHLWKFAAIIDKNPLLHICIHYVKKILRESHSLRVKYIKASLSVIISKSQISIIRMGTSFPNYCPLAGRCAIMILFAISPLFYHILPPLTSPRYHREGTIPHDKPRL